ncbi:MAG: nucleoside deaminase [Ruminococcaceae bacterium]|nr:nucleoside deaminase [Oscillospiraceae bacterium]
MTHITENSGSLPLCFEDYMKSALALAGEAAAAGEVPVGCVICDENGAIIGEGRNRREEIPDACAHAEIEAIRNACAYRGSWDLSGCTMFVTLEPCCMCAGAIINSRISRLVYGAKESYSGACGSVINLFEENFGHKPKIYGGVLAKESAKLLSEFFNKLRDKKR